MNYGLADSQRGLTLIPLIPANAGTQIIWLRALPFIRPPAGTRAGATPRSRFVWALARTFHQKSLNTCRESRDKPGMTDNWLASVLYDLGPGIRRDERILRVKLRVRSVTLERRANVGSAHGIQRPQRIRQLHRLHPDVGHGGRLPERAAGHRADGEQARLDPSERVDAPATSRPHPAKASVRPAARRSRQNSCTEQRIRARVRVHFGPVQS